MRGMGGQSVASLLACILAVAVVCLVTAIAGCGGTGTEPNEPASDEALYENPDYAPSTDQDGDVPTVTLGGYTFASDSCDLTHPYIPLTASSAGWFFNALRAGAGRDDDRLIYDFSYGGQVRGIKCLRMRRVECTGANTEDGLAWVAQDTEGNVHYLKLKTIDDGTGTGGSAHYAGVAAGDPAWFWLPGTLTVGKKWYWEPLPDLRWRVADLDATVRRFTHLAEVALQEDIEGWQWEESGYWQPGGGLRVIATAKEGGGPSEGWIRP